MDHNRDNPLKRFTAFWIAFLLVATFGIGCIILRPLTHGKVDTAYEEIAAGRLAIKEEVKKAEGEALNTKALENAIKAQSKTLQQAPTAGAMAVPGTEPMPAPDATPAPESTPEPTN